MSGSAYDGWDAPDAITVGRHSYGNPRAITYQNPRPPESCVEIGNFCSIAAGVEFLLDGEHRTRLITTSPMLSLAPLPEGHNHGHGPIRIGHDVWIGREARILSGVNIGTGAVIGAYAVVAHDIPAYAIAVGNPAHVARYRFEANIRERLLASGWWELPDEQIIQLAPLLYDQDPARLLGAIRAS